MTGLSKPPGKVSLHQYTAVFDNSGKPVSAEVLLYSGRVSETRLKFIRKIFSHVAMTARRLFLHTHTHTHARTHARTHTHTHTHTQTHTHTHTNTNTHARTHARARARRHTHTHIRPIDTLCMPSAVFSHISETVQGLFF